jgi:hypothetical protein
MIDPRLKRRSIALTVGVTVLTVSGALIGASLKSERQNSGLQVLITSTEASTREEKAG